MLRIRANKTQIVQQVIKSVAQTCKYSVTQSNSGSKHTPIDQTRMCAGLDSKPLKW